MLYKPPTPFETLPGAPLASRIAISPCSSAHLHSPAIFRFYGHQPDLRAQTDWNPETDTPARGKLGSPMQTLLLQPRSLLLFSASAFREHCHEVAALPGCKEVVGAAAPVVNAGLTGAHEGDLVKRRRRVSLTVRHLGQFLFAPGVPE